MSNNRNKYLPFFIGVDKWFNTFDVLEEMMPSNFNYPPYNIIVNGEKNYKIQMAVVGFKKEDISIEMVNDVLTVKGSIKNNGSDVKYLYKGLGFRDFVHNFKISNSLEVYEANFNDGMLEILLRYIEKEGSTKKINING